MPYEHARADKKIVILENWVWNDGVGDYSHLKDIMIALHLNPHLATYYFIPVICTGNERLKKQIYRDFLDMGVTEFYVGKCLDFEADTELGKQLRPVYESAEELLEISFSGVPNMARLFLRPDVAIKKIREHEYYSSLKWCQGSGHVTLVSSLGIGPTALGIKIADIKKTTPMAFFTTLEKHDKEFASKLLSTSQSANFTEFMVKNTFTHAYFSDFTYMNGFSVFLALLSANSSSQKNIVVHLSSGSQHLEYYVNYETRVDGANNPLINGAGREYP